MHSQKKVLIAPLDWGLGHATRCVPIIREFLAQEIKVIIGGNGNSLQLLRQEFPQLQFIEIPGHSFKYGSGFNQVISILRQLPAFLRQIEREHRQLEQIAENENIGLIISDNRYGLWHKTIPSVIITHQLKIKLPNTIKIFSSLVNNEIRNSIENFTECWVPDIENEIQNLSGDLSHEVNIPKPLPYFSREVYFIGPLSRFSLPNDEAGKVWDILAIISGPEPQRTIFEEMILRQCLEMGLKTLIVSGKPSENKTIAQDNVLLKSHLNSEELQNAILQSEIVICRSGYSSVMDLVKLRKKAILVPTPGQTEQEYLAKWLIQQGLFYSTNQKGLDIKKALEISKAFDAPDGAYFDDRLLSDHIQYIIQKYLSSPMPFVHQL